MRINIMLYVLIETKRSVHMLNEGSAEACWRKTVNIPYFMASAK